MNRLTSSLLARRWVTFRSNATREREVSAALREIVEPITSKHLSNLGCVKSVKVDDAENVKVELDLLVPGYPHGQKLEATAEEAIKRLGWPKNVVITRSDPAPYSPPNPKSPALSKVKHIIGIASCKGGVGKSTVAVQLACALARWNLRVGLLDADIYGPSLPFQLEPLYPTVKRSPENPKNILPLISKTHSNLKMLSFGHVNPNSGAPGSGGQSAALVRGPIANKIITQMLLGTDWGDLDYLLVDLPPGTGDIQITLSQLCSFSGTAMVTTPHKLAMADVAKGLVLFKTVSIPTLVIVENMAYFECAHHTKHYIFGRGGKQKLLDALAALPQGAAGASGIREEVQEAPLFTLPLVSQDEEAPGGGIAQLEAGYDAIARGVVERLFSMQANLHVIPSVSWEKERKSLRLRYFTPSSASEHLVPFSLLATLHPQTGLPVTPALPTSAPGLPQPSPEEEVAHVEVRGSYGVGVEWRGGSSKIFPFDVLKTIAQDLS